MNTDYLGITWGFVVNTHVKNLAAASESHKYPSVEQEQPLYSISINAPAARRNDFSFPNCFDFISAERSIRHHSSFTSHTSISRIYPLACDWLHRHAARRSAANWFIHLRAAKEFQPQTDCTSLSLMPTFPPILSVCASICSMIACSHAVSIKYRSLGFKIPTAVYKHTTHANISVWVFFFFLLFNYFPVNMHRKPTLSATHTSNDTQDQVVYLKEKSLFLYLVRMILFCASYRMSL